MFRILFINRNRLFFVLLLLFLNRIMAQVLPCGSPAADATMLQTREQKILQLKQQFANARLQAGVTYIPIKAHIIRQSNGSGGLSLIDLNKSLLQINALYINTDIQFFFCGSAPNYINNNNYFDLDNTEESALCTTNDVNNAINVYFANSIAFGSLAVSGYAYFPSTSSSTNRVFVVNNAAVDGRTVPHELGHYFNLYHTFQGSAGATSDRELVTRSPSSGANCNTAGDLLCDTPSDPYGRASDSTQLIGCNYTGNARDTQGQLYNPSTSNIMSYYPVSCGNVFTSGQYARIADGVLLRSDPANQYIFNCVSSVVGANVPSGLTGTLGVSGLNLNFTDNSSNEMGFIVERSTTSPTSGFMPVAGLSPNVTTYTDPGVSSFTTYYYRVKASNSSNQYSSVLQITTTLNYCTPLYDNSCDVVPVLIDDFELKETSNNTLIISNLNSNCSPNNYGDFTATSHTVEVGKNYTFTARAISGGIGTYFDQHLTIWIDYNRDGVFRTNEIIYKSNSNSATRMTPTATGTLTIPNISPGIVRMRLRTGFGSFSPVIDSCNALPFGEVEDYHLNVITSLPTISSGTVFPLTACTGQSISVSFTSTIPTGTGTYTVQLSDNSGGNFANIATFGTGSPLTANIPVGTPSGIGYKVRVVSTNPNITGLTSTAFPINTTPNPPIVTSPLNYQQNQTASPLSATGSSLKWYNSASSGTGISSAPTPSTSNIGSTNYYVSQTVSSCESARSIISVNVVAPTSTTACLNIKAFLEGAYLSAGQMTTLLNTSGTLPGQTATDPFAMPTPSGQPYKGAPWNYNGTETVASYNANVVDWVLVSLRINSEDKTTTVYKTAALLNKNGTITTVAACPSLNTSQGYYVAIEHRNHIGAISHQPKFVAAGTLSYDFTTQDSYIPSSSLGYGQELKGGVYCLIGGDCQKYSAQEINTLDNNKWRAENGNYAIYILTDLNLDGEVNATDRLIWRKNNGKFSGIDF